MRLSLWHGAETIPMTEPRAIELGKHVLGEPSRAGFLRFLAILQEEIVALPSRYDTTVPTWHALGFLHCQLFEMDDGGQLRLHVWPPKRFRPGMPDWRPHSHLWTISSRIVCGCINNIVYEVRMGVRGAEGRLYEVGWKDSCSFRIATDSRVSCRTLSTRELHPGDAYQIPTGEFHSTVARNDVLSATVVLTQDRTTQAPLVVGEWGCADVYRYPPRVCDQEEWSDTLSQLNDTICSQMAS